MIGSGALVRKDYLKDDTAKVHYILIVEDDPGLAKLLLDLFRLSGNRCFVIHSKGSAERFLKQVRPDLVVIDYQLIGGIGLEAAKIARDRNVPVIITSGHLGIFDRVREAGYFYLRKPFTPSELLALASMLLGADLRLPGDPPTEIH